MEVSWTAVLNSAAADSPQRTSSRDKPADDGGAMLAPDRRKSKCCWISISARPKARAGLCIVALCRLLTATCARRAQKCRTPPGPPSLRSETEYGLNLQNERPGFRPGACTMSMHDGRRNRSEEGDEENTDGRRRFGVVSCLGGIRFGRSAASVAVALSGSSNADHASRSSGLRPIRCGSSFRSRFWFSGCWAIASGGSAPACTPPRRRPATTR